MPPPPLPHQPPATTTEMSLAELQQATNSFDDDSRGIGRGLQGVVYKADLRMPAAFKLLSGVQGEDEIRREVEHCSLAAIILTRCRFTPSASTRPQHASSTRLPLAESRARIVFRANDAKSRLALLGCANPSPLPWRLRCRILCDAPRLDLPPRRQPQVLHRDVKPPNVLLDEQCNARLADVGLQRRA